MEERAAGNWWCAGTWHRSDTTTSHTRILMQMPGGVEGDWATTQLGNIAVTRVTHLQLGTVTVTTVTSLNTEAERLESEPERVARHRRPQLSWRDITAHCYTPPNTDTEQDWKLK